MTPTQSRLINVLIVVFWLYLLLDAYFQGRELPGLINDLDLPELPVVLSACLVLIITALCGVVTFWQRKNIMEDMPYLSSFIDRVLGKGAYNQFTLRLRPVSASIATSLVLATVGLYSTSQTTQDNWSYLLFFGFLAFALSMFVAYLLSRRFPPALR